MESALPSSTDAFQDYNATGVELEVVANFLRAAIPLFAAFWGKNESASGHGTRRGGSGRAHAA